MTTSNLGRWTRWYDMVDEPQPYGNSDTYQKGADFLVGLSIEDWGCGKGWMRQFVPPHLYYGVDGSASKFADHVADLAEYRSDVEGIFMRHVLEHDYRWRQILRNAAASARERIVIVLFTPLAEVTHDLAWNADPGVPDISFALKDLCSALDVKFTVTVEEIRKSPTQYGVETVLYGHRRPTR